MEKKNSLLLTVIAIATLLVAVIGATFAYFASGVTESNTVVNVRTASAASFSSSINNSLSIYADAVNMADDEHKGNWTNTASADVKIALAGDPGSYCTYSLIYEEDEDSADYEPYTDYQGGGLSITTTPTGADVNNSDLATTLKYTTKSGYENLVGYTTSHDKTQENVEAVPEIIDEGMIKVPTNSTSTEYHIDVTLLWENLNTDQLSNAGKTFFGVLKVTDVECFDSNNQPLASGN